MGAGRVAARSRPTSCPAPARSAPTLVGELGHAVRLARWSRCRSPASALLAAVIGGVGLAILFAQSRWIELALFPYAVILQVTPIVAIAPLIII